jgi:hypothetical protein
MVESKRPLPFGELRLVDPLLVRIIDVVNHLILEPLLDVRAGNLQLGNSIENIDGKIEPINSNLDCQFQGRVDITMFLVPTHVGVIKIVV